MRQGYVYMLSNKPRGTIYIGVTSNLLKRVYQHKSKFVNGFCKKYNLDKLIYFEVIEDIQQAIEREKALKNWRRDWKISLIEEHNPEWRDLYSELSQWI